VGALLYLKKSSQDSDIYGDLSPFGNNLSNIYYRPFLDGFRKEIRKFSEDLNNYQSMGLFSIENSATSAGGHFGFLSERRMLNYTQFLYRLPIRMIFSLSQYYLILGLCISP